MSRGWTTAPVSTICGTAPPRTAVRHGAARFRSRSSLPDSHTRPQTVSRSPTATMTAWPGTALIFILHGAKVQVTTGRARSEEHTSELQSRFDLVCRLLLEK